MIDVKDMHRPEAQALLCDSIVNQITKNGSIPLDYGRSTRTIPRDLFQAVAFRDQHCRFPGCDRRPSWCQCHHVRHWIDGGPTKLHNLVLLCDRHHHVIHQRGWAMKLEPDAALEVTTPEGRVMRTHPPPRDLRLPLVA